MQGKRTPLTFKRLDSGKYYCPDLGIIIAKERVGAGTRASHQRIQWGMCAGGAWVQVETLSDCKEFLNTIYERAAEKTAAGRTKAQAKLLRGDESGRWVTADGIKVTSVKNPVRGTHIGPRLAVQLDQSLEAPPALIPGTVKDVERFLRCVPWRKPTGDHQ